MGVDMSKEATDRPLLSKGTQAGTGSAPGPPPPSRPSRLRGCTTRVLGKGVALQPAKPERLARALRSNTFQLTSAMSPANPNTALGQPPWPPPPGPPVSSSRPAPPPPRATLSRGAPAGSERKGDFQPSSAASQAPEV